MSFPTNGVYMIKNIGRDLMLDLKGNNTAEGTPIQGFAGNGTMAQQWVIKRARIVLQQVCYHSVQQQRL